MSRSKHSTAFLFGVDRDSTSNRRPAAWERRDQRTMSVARAIYQRLPGDARLWLRRREFVSPDRLVIEKALALAEPAASVQDASP